MQEYIDVYISHALKEIKINELALKKTISAISAGSPSDECRKTEKSQRLFLGRPVCLSVRLAHKSSFWARSATKNAKRDRTIGSYHTRPENQANDFEKVYLSVCSCSPIHIYEIRKRKWFVPLICTRRTKQWLGSFDWLVCTIAFFVFHTVGRFTKAVLLMKNDKKESAWNKQDILLLTCWS